MINLFWFRRDLRLDDNHALFEALNAGLPVLAIFIFDKAILDKLPKKKDARVEFIHKQLQQLNEQLTAYGSSLLVLHGKPYEQFELLIKKYPINQVFANEDYEPYALLRDKNIGELLKFNEIRFSTFKDHVVFSANEVLKQDGNPYTVFTPYSRKWKEKLNQTILPSYPSQELLNKLLKQNIELPDIQHLGYEKSGIAVPEPRLDNTLLEQYAENRNFPGVHATSMIGPHLRFGTLSIRKVVAKALKLSETWLNELIWREFFMQIMLHFPHSARDNFHAKYNFLPWRNDEAEFRRWCEGNTGFPMVDAGMRELNTTGFMHNRVRMITAGFLTKHLLIDWRWGEAYFAEKLLDFELSSNVGNWQWAAGTGCDAAPYFRVFNPEEQLKKFDPNHSYIRKWVPEYNQFTYKPMVEHAFARNRAIETYKVALNSL